MQSIKDKIEAWLPEALLEELRAAGPQVGGPPWVLEMSVVALAAAGHAALAEDVLERPAALTTALTRLLVAKEALPQGVRVCLRPKMPWKDPISLQQALRLATAAPSSLRSLTGVVAGVSAGEEALVEATYVCGECGTEARELGVEASTAPVCTCGVVMGADPARCVTTPSKTILLAPLSSPEAWDATVVSENGQAEVTTAPVVVRLRDDLAGVCDVGDVVEITGAVHVVLDEKSCGTRRPALGRFCVEALGARVLGPAHRLAALTDDHNISEDTENLVDCMKYGDLGAMLEALGAWARPPLGAVGQVALLLSAASAGARGEEPNLGEIGLYDPDPECDALHLGRHAGAHDGFNSPPPPPPRVNVLVLTHGHDTTFERMLQQMARGLCSQVPDGGVAGAPLLPTAMTLPGAPHLAAGGQLGQASAGVCLLRGTDLTSKQGRALGEALHDGSVAVALPGGGAATVPLRPTIWCLVSAEELGATAAAQAPAKKKSKPWGAARAAAPTPLPPAAAAFAEKFSPQLANQFDVVLDFWYQEESEVEAWADAFLAGLIETGESSDTESLAPETALEALQLHVAAAQALAPPRMTPAAMRLLSTYYSAVRDAGGARAVPLTLEGAARLAAAAARLCLRAEIAPFPDAALAVALCEESLAARGWVPLLWGPLRATLAAGRATLDDCLRQVHAQLDRAGKAGGASGGWGVHEE